MLYSRTNCNTQTQRWIAVLIIASITFTIAGCGLFSSAKNKKAGLSLSENEITIYSSFEDQFFYRFYGNYLIQKYPNIKLRLIQSTSETVEETVKEIQQIKPDLVITSKYNFRELQNQNVLTDLSVLAERSNMNVETLYQPMIDTLKDDSGKLSGLSPLVTPSVLFYNKDLFDTNRIAYPVNQMSWDELLTLTQSFIGSGTVGFTGRSPASILEAVSISKGWNIVNNQTNDLLFDSQEWTSSIQKILDASSDGNIAHFDGNIAYDSKLFLQGKAAMHYGSLSMIPALLEENLFSWGVVTTPVDPLNRDISQDIYFYDLFCIPSEAAQKDEAWEMIQALLDEDAVDYLQNNSIPGSVSTLNEFMNAQYGGVDLSAIWMQKIGKNSYLSSKLPLSFTSQFYEIVDTTLTNAIQNQNRTALECLKEIEEHARAIYQEEFRSNIDY